MSDLSNPYKAPAASDDAAGGSVTPGGVTGKSRELLGQSSPWLKFLGILGYIFVGIIAAAAVAMGIFGGMMGSAFGDFGAMLGPALAAVYLLLAVFLFFPARMLMRMAKSAKKYKLQADPADLEGVALNIRGLARFYGITTLVVIVIYALVFLVLAIVGLSSMNQ